MKLDKWTKVYFTGIFIASSVFGFMIKLPAVFRHNDKLLHSLFYFLAAAFLNILFANVKLFRHVILFIFLFLFGVGIEFAQEFSNKFLHKKIHGRFDIEDIHANLNGLILFTLIWIVYFFFTKISKEKQ